MEAQASIDYTAHVALSRGNPDILRSTETEGQMVKGVDRDGYLLLLL